MTHLRIAAGACVLSTGLLIGSASGAIALADPDSSATAPSNDASSTNQPAGPARAPIGGVADSIRTALQNAAQGVTGTLNSLGKPHAPTTSPATTVGGSPTVHGTPLPGDTTADDAGATTPETTAPDATAADTAASNTAPQNATAPKATPAAPSATPATPHAPVAATTIVDPVANVITAVTNSVASTQALLASLPTSTTPVVDVITSVQQMLTSIVQAGTPLVQLPTDLAGLLGVGTGFSGTTNAGGNDRVGPLSAPVYAFPTPATVAPLLPSAIVGAPATAPPAAPMTPLDVIRSVASPAPTASETPQPAAQNSSVLSTVKTVIGAIVASVSLATLAAMALPGIIGLLGTCAAGIRIGYRQAKAAAALPTTAIARFAGSGPMGVVRTGGQISLRRRAARPAAKPSSVTLLERAS